MVRIVNKVKNILFLRWVEKNYETLTFLPASVNFFCIKKLINILCCMGLDADQMFLLIFFSFVLYLPDDCKKCINSKYTKTKFCMNFCWETSSYNVLFHLEV